MTDPVIEVAKTPLDRLAAAANDFMTALYSEDLPPEVVARLAFAAGSLHGEALHVVSEVACLTSANTATGASGPARCRT